MPSQEEYRQGGPSAGEIQQKLTEISQKGILTNNFDLFRSCFHLPHKISNFENTFVLENDDDVRRIFDMVRGNLKDLGVTRYERVCLSASFLSSTRIAAVHESYMYSGERLLDEATVVMGVVEKRDGAWRVVSSQYATPRTNVFGPEFINKSDPGRADDPNTPPSEETKE